MTQNLIAGVDIGGTKTQILLSNDGVIFADETVPSASWRTWEREHDIKSLSSLINRVAKDQTLSCIAIGAHGCNTGAQCIQLEDDLTAFMETKIKVVNDSELMVPAAGFISGIGVVSGTGSIAVARTKDGEMLVAGGWGWILGDEGSAAALVREAGRTIRRAIDKNQTDDVLVEKFMNQLTVNDPTKIGRQLNAVRSAADWGRYASAVFAAADAGSPLAIKVITDGAHALAELVGVLLARGADATCIVAGGGVIAEQPMLMEAFRAAVTEISPLSTVTLLRKPPVLGALALAKRMLINS